MLEEVKKQVIESMFPKKVKDIFVDDKFTQAEKRYQRYRESRKSSEFAAAGLLLMYGFFFFSASAYGFGNIILGIILLAGGGYLGYLGYLKLKMLKRLPNYFSCIAESKNGSLDDISANLGYPYEMVVSDIEFLINKGILEKTFVNHSKRIIVSPLIGEIISKASRSVICPNCGATNQIIGQTTECEFCGSILQ